MSGRRAAVAGPGITLWCGAGRLVRRRAGRGGGRGRAALTPRRDAARTGWGATLRWGRFVWPGAELLLPGEVLLLLCVGLAATDEVVLCQAAAFVWPGAALLLPGDVLLVTGDVVLCPAAALVWPGAAALLPGDVAPCPGAAAVWSGTEPLPLEVSLLPDTVSLWPDEVSLWPDDAPPLADNVAWWSGAEPLFAGEDALWLVGVEGALEVGFCVKFAGLDGVGFEVCAGLTGLPGAGEPPDAEAPAEPVLVAGWTAARVVVAARFPPRAVKLVPCPRAEALDRRYEPGPRPCPAAAIARDTVAA